MTSSSSSSPPRVALLGLGLMGNGMAHRLVGAGFPLTVFNRTAEKATSVVAAGGRRADSPREAAVDAQFVISMIADDVASRDLWLGEGGALGSVPPGAVLIESSTVSTSWIRELSNAAQSKGCDLLDAPVTGSRAQAESGELTFLVGGSDSALDRARPVFSAMGKNVVHVGPSGSGALLKLINNFMCGVQAASLAEALVVIERAGLDRDKATALLMKGAPGSPLVNTLVQRMMSNDFSPRFHLALMRKDIEYASKEAERVGVTLSTGEAALGAFERAVSSGHGMADVSAIVEQVRKA